MSNNYRNQIYDRYASQMQGAERLFNEQAAKRWGKAYGYYLRRWLPTDSGSKILECACGYGRFMQFLKDRGYGEVTAVDISPEQVAIASQVGFPVVCENVLHYLERTDAEFELIVAMDLVEHFGKDEVLLFLKGCYRALKENGRLILQTPNAAGPGGMASRYNDLTHEVCFNPSILSRLLASNGFVGIEAREAGPVPWGYSALSSVRFLLWQGLRAGLTLWTMVETGGAGTGIFTRNFLISGNKS